MGAFTVVPQPISYVAPVRLQCYFGAWLGCASNKKNKDAYVLHEVSGDNNDCLLRCMMSTFHGLGLKWSDVAKDTIDRIKVMLALAGGDPAPESDASAFASSKAEALTAHCAVIEADQNVADLRGLLFDLIGLGIDIASEGCIPEYNGRYGLTDDLKKERRRVKAGNLISWSDCIPLLADFLFPAGTVLECYNRLFPGVAGAFTSEKFNESVIHILNPQTHRLAKASLCDLWVARGPRQGQGAVDQVVTELRDDKIYEVESEEAPREKKTTHLFMHCPYGKPYGSDMRTPNDHFVPIEVVGNIDDVTAPQLASKWTKGVLNLHREDERYAASPHD